jgi:polyisoprenoid-binding protein YceI
MLGSKDESSSSPEEAPKEARRRIWRWVVAGLVFVVVLGIGLGVAGWFFFLKSDAAPRAAIRRTPVVDSPTSTLDGTWSVQPEGADNFVGYRVTEQLPAAIAEQETTGRTNDVTATLVIHDTTISAVDVTADLRELKSDNSLRDSAIKSSGLESDTYPAGVFTLTDPILLRELPRPGETIKTRATGKFTLHGVTRRVTVELRGRWDGERIQVVGSLPVLFADYDMTPPAVPAVASIDNKGEMEFQLFFERT